MNLPADRRLIIAAVAAVAVVVIGLIVLANRKPAEPDDSAGGGLKVEVGRNEKIDAKMQLPCYVNGQSVGMTTLADCARRNGVETGQLGVGIDQSGSMAYGQAGAELAPLPPEEEPAFAQNAGAPSRPVIQPPPPAAPGVVVVTPAGGPVAACWRFAGDWNRLPEMSLGACVQTLYAGLCIRRGDAAYGRWGEQTLRLYNGRIEQAPDNHNFRTLVRQGPNCSVPAL